MSREKFEAWGMSDVDLRITLESETYAGIAWMAWQAATASMQAEREQLAAENVVLKGYISEKCYIVDPKADLTANADIPAEDFQPQTPATDRFLAEQRAQGVDAAIAAAKKVVAQEFQYKNFDVAQRDCSKFPESDLVGKVEMVEWLADFAAQLRNEVKV